MLETTDRVRSGRWPLGLLGALAMVAAVEQAIDRQKLAALGGSQWAYEVARAAADSGDKDCQVLCFGDSLLKQGLAPTVIEAAGGLKAYNFALSGGQAPGDYFLLRRALDSGYRPGAIVLECLPKLLSSDPDFNVENWPFVAGPADGLEMARLLKNPGLFADLELRQLLPSVRCRNSIRANLKAALDGTFPIFANAIFGARRNWEVNRGAEIVASRPGRVEDLEAWVRGYYPKFSCTKANRAYLKKFLELASSRQIPVFWVLPPYQPALQARCEQSGFDAAHEAFLRSLQDRFRGLYVVDGRHSGYDPAVFTDLHHLGREGAAIFSGEVGELLRRHREDPSRTPRWLRLEDYRPTASKVPFLEDVEESQRKVVEIAAKASASLAR